MKLYSYWRSGTSYRVRLALALKDATVDIIPVDLAAGEHRDPAFRSINPQGLVPTLELDDGTRISQSPAIIEYLDETLPGPKLLPDDPIDRARARHLAALIGCDVHPLQNLRVQRYVMDPLGHDQSVAHQWAAHWIEAGFEALEAELTRADHEGPYAMGDRPGLVECYVIPQMFGGRRFGAEPSKFPRLLAMEEATLAWPNVQASKPESQPEAL